MAVSVDDKGKVKVWNIRNFKCIQTLDFGDKVTIMNVLDLGKERRIALVGSRIIMLKFENKVEEVPKVVPQSAKISEGGLVVFTNRDMRKVDLNTGKLL